MYLAMVYKLAGEKNRNAIAFGQVFVFGLINALILYFLGMQITNNRIISSVCAILYNLDLFTIQFDFAILSESLSSLLLLASLILILTAVKKPSWLWSVFAGFVLGFAALVRPAFVPVLAPCILFFVIYVLFFQKEPVSRIKKLSRISLFVILSVLPCFIWLLGNYRMGKGFSFSPFMLNAGLTNHTGNFFEGLPDKYAPIRDPFIKLRNERKTSIGGYYRVQKEMYQAARKKLGIKTEREFEKLITRLCIKLIKDNPRLYFKTFRFAWEFMWEVRTLVFFESENFQEGKNFNRIHRKFLWGLWFDKVEIGVLQTERFNKLQFPLFLISAFLVIFLNIKNKDRLIPSCFLFIIIMTLSIFINALEFSENPRYRGPFHPLVLLFCFSCLGMIIKLGFLKIKSALMKNRVPSSSPKRKKKLKSK